MYIGSVFIRSFRSVKIINIIFCQPYQLSRLTLRRLKDFRFLQFKILRQNKPDIRGIYMFFLVYNNDTAQTYCAYCLRSKNILYCYKRPSVLNRVCLVKVFLQSIAYQQIKTDRTKRLHLPGYILIYNLQQSLQMLFFILANRIR